MNRASPSTTCDVCGAPIVTAWSVTNLHGPYTVTHGECVTKAEWEKLRPPQHTCAPPPVVTRPDIVAAAQLDLLHARQMERLLSGKLVRLLEEIDAYRAEIARCVDVILEEIKGCAS